MAGRTTSVGAGVVPERVPADGAGCRYSGAAVHPVLPGLAGAEAEDDALDPSRLPGLHPVLHRLVRFGAAVYRERADLREQFDQRLYLGNLPDRPEIGRAHV